MCQQVYILLYAVYAHTRGVTYTTRVPQRRGKTYTSNMVLCSDIHVTVDPWNSGSTILCYPRYHTTWMYDKTKYWHYVTLHASRALCTLQALVHPYVTLRNTPAWILLCPYPQLDATRPSTDTTCQPTPLYLRCTPGMWKRDQTKYLQSLGRLQARYLHTTPVCRQGPCGVHPGWPSTCGTLEMALQTSITTPGWWSKIPSF